MTSLKATVAQYFTDSTVHGFKYVAVGKNVAIRIVWILLIIGEMGYWPLLGPELTLFENLVKNDRFKSALGKNKNRKNNELTIK